MEETSRQSSIEGMFVVLDDPNNLSDADRAQTMLVKEAFLPNEPALVAKETIDLVRRQRLPNELLVGVLRIRLQRPRPKGRGIPRTIATSTAVAATMIRAK